MAAPKANRARVTLERAGAGEAGTVHATIGLVPKVCAEPSTAFCFGNAGGEPSTVSECRNSESAEPRRWGGARNRRDRVTDVITLQQARGVLAAVAYAERIGLPLNRLETVHWGAMGLSDAEAGAALGRLLKLLRDALAARGLPFAYVWVRENDDGDASKGSHVHILAHVPTAAGRGFMRRLRRWVRLAAGARYNRRRGRIEGPGYATGAVDTRRIGGKLAVPQEVHDANLAEALGYLLKGANKITADILALERLEPGGRVTGKRCGWSENIGAKARRRVE